MNKKEFWELMDGFRLQSNGNTELFFDLAQETLSNYPEDQILSFNAYLGAYLEVVNGCIWVYMACKVINGYVSDDTGLFFSLWLIAQGEQVLTNALHDPDSLADLPAIPFGNAEFEMLMAVGMPSDEPADLDDFTQKQQIIRNRHKAVLTKIENELVYKNGDKQGGYATFEAAMADIPNILPRLIKYAEKENFDWQVKQSTPGINQASQYQSRCGLLCLECPYQKSHGCKGCLNITSPFWDEACPVKVCCENNQLAHCGLCPDIPCDLLKAFSYDPEQGDNGRRIKQCLLWKQA